MGKYGPRPGSPRYRPPADLRERRLFAADEWKGTFGGGWTPDGRDDFWERLLRGTLEDFRAA